MKRLVADEDEARPVEVHVDVEAVLEVMFFLFPDNRKRVTS